MWLALPADAQLPPVVSGPPANPDFVIVENGGRIIANAFEDQGGNIDITTKALLVSDDSIISASSELGVSGIVRVASRLLQGTPDGMLPSFALASAPQIVAACQ